MKKTILSFGIATILALTSCASYHSGTLQNSSSLSSSNFSYIKKGIKGVRKCTYILGIGGFSKQAIADEAKEELLKENSLGNNQALANITVNYKSKYFFGYLYQEVICTITADVVEFNK